MQPEGLGQTNPVHPRSTKGQESSRGSGTAEVWAGKGGAALEISGLKHSVRESRCFTPEPTQELEVLTSLNQVGKPWSSQGGAKATFHF